MEKIDKFPARIKMLSNQVQVQGIRSGYILDLFSVVRFCSRYSQVNGRKAWLMRGTDMDDAGRFSVQVFLYLGQ